MLRVVKCNYAVPTRKVRRGAAAYLDTFTWGCPERVRVIVKNRYGRRIAIYEHIMRLDNFRFVTIPEDSWIVNKCIVVPDFWTVNNIRELIRVRDMEIRRRAKSGVT